MLHELSPNIGGHVLVKGTVAYSAQAPWIQTQTIRENICFGAAYDEARYLKVTRACALHNDFKAFQDGDLTVIGDRGINLSGGQRARVALARMAYAEADIYLMDDPLSAVDPGVGKHLFEEVSSLADCITVGERAANDYFCCCWLDAPFRYAAVISPTRLAYWSLTRPNSCLIIIFHVLWCWKTDVSLAVVRTASYKLKGC